MAAATAVCVGLLALPALWINQDFFYRGAWWRFGPTMLGVAVRKYQVRVQADQ